MQYMSERLLLPCRCHWCEYMQRHRILHRRGVRLLTFISWLLQSLPRLDQLMSPNLHTYNYTVVSSDIYPHNGAYK